MEPCPPGLDDDGKALWEQANWILGGGAVAPDAQLQMTALFIRRELRLESALAAHHAPADAANIEQRAREYAKKWRHLTEQGAACDGYLTGAREALAAHPAAADADQPVTEDKWKAALADLYFASMGWGCGCAGTCKGCKKRIAEAEKNAGELLGISYVVKS